MAKAMSTVLNHLHTIEILDLFVSSAKKDLFDLLPLPLSPFRLFCAGIFIQGEGKKVFKA